MTIDTNLCHAINEARWIVIGTCQVPDYHQKRLDVVQTQISGNDVAGGQAKTVYNNVYQYGAAIVNDSQNLVDCKNRKITSSQRRGMLTINHHAKRLDYVIQALKSVPTAYDQAYIQRQLQDVLTPIVGATRQLAEVHGEGMNTCQHHYLNAIRSNADKLMSLLAEPNSTAL